MAFATKPALAGRMLGRALDAGLPCAWVLGDEIYGSDRRLRMDLERREQPFVLAIRSNETLWAGLDKRLGQHAASRLAARLRRPSADPSLATPLGGGRQQRRSALRLGPPAPDPAAAAALGALAAGPAQ